jgi:hypothetical protein
VRICHGRKPGHGSATSARTPEIEHNDMTNAPKLEIVTADAVACSEGVESQVEIYPQHVRLRTELAPGEMVVHEGDHEVFLAVGEGLVEITNDRVAIVTDMAVPTENIEDPFPSSVNQLPNPRSSARLINDAE